MKRETIWTNSLYLYPDRVEIKTFNHREQRWLPELDRVVIPPEFKANQQPQLFLRGPVAPLEMSPP